MDKKKFGSLLLAKKKIGSLKKLLLKILLIGSQCGGFQFMLILDLWGISFHPAVVIGLGNDLLFNSSVGHCEPYIRTGSLVDQDLIVFCTYLSTIDVPLKISCRFGLV
jgi:hypothetical protein